MRVVRVQLELIGINSGGRIPAKHPRAAALFYHFSFAGERSRHFSKSSLIRSAGVSFLPFAERINELFEKWRDLFAAKLKW